MSLTIVLYDRDRSTVDREVSEFAGVFTNADGLLFPETYNQLNALFAVVPGNYAQNLRKMYLLLEQFTNSYRAVNGSLNHAVASFWVMVGSSCATV